MAFKANFVLNSGGERDLPLEKADPLQYFHDYLYSEDPYGALMQGGFGLFPDGKLWNGDHGEGFDQVIYDDLYMATAFPGAVSSILNGYTKTDFFFYEMSDAHMHRISNRKVRIWDHTFEEGFEVDVIKLGQELLEVGKKYLAFISAGLDWMKKEMENATGERQRKRLKKKRNQVKEWNVAECMDELEFALENVNLDAEGNILWNDFEAVIEGNQPEVSYARGPGKTHEYFNLHWSNPTKRLKRRILNFVWTSQESGAFEWNNPLYPENQQYMMQRRGDDQGKALVITLACRAKGKQLPFASYHVGVYLFIPYKWTRQDPPRKLWQARYDEVSAANWYAQLRKMGPPLRLEPGFFFENHTWNGIHDSDKRNMYTQLKIGPIGEGLKWAEAILAVLEGEEQVSWDEKAVLKDPRSGMITMQMQDKTSRAPEALLLVYGFLNELDQLAPRLAKIIALAEGDAKMAWLRPAVEALALPTLIARMRAMAKALQGEGPEPLTLEGP